MQSPCPSVNFDKNLQLFCIEMKIIYYKDCNMQNVNFQDQLFSTNNINCVEINLPPDEPPNHFKTSIQNAQKTLDSLERSLHKCNEYELRLQQCKNTHNFSHYTNHRWWDSDQSEPKSSQCPPRHVSPSSASSGVGLTESWSTMSIVCLQYQYEELSKRYESLLQAYDDQCRSSSVRDMRAAQWRQRANLTHAQLTHAHTTLLAVGDKYLTLKRKRNALKSRYEERIKQLKGVLHDMVEVTAREQLRFDAKLSYCMSAERNSDAALLLYEIRKCNLLFLENMRLKTAIEELLPGQANWNKY